MPILDTNEMLGQVFEPILQHRFIMYIDGIPSFMIKSVDGIGFDDGEVTIDHINSYFKVRAKRRWNDLNVVLYNAVTPNGAQAVMEWARLQYEYVTGRAGYADFYWKDLKFNALSPAGEIVTEWVVKKAFIKNIANFGSYDWAASEYTSIPLVIANSGMILNF